MTRDTKAAHKRLVPIDGSSKMPGPRGQKELINVLNVQAHVHTDTWIHTLGYTHTHTMFTDCIILNIVPLNYLKGKDVNDQIENVSSCVMWGGGGS